MFDEVGTRPAGHFVGLDLACADTALNLLPIYAQRKGGLVDTEWWYR